MTRRALLAALIICLAPIANHAASQGASQSYSAAGLYNLANSYARAGKPGLAVLDYERASLLAPNDPDIEANLRYVLESQRLPTESRSTFSRAITAGPPALIAWLGLLGLALVLASVLAKRLAGRSGYANRWGYRRAFILGMALVSLTVCNGVVLWPRLHEGVVITDAAPVRVSPVPMGDPLFVLPQATTVRISAQHEGFALIETKAGRKGWVSRENIAPIVPRK